MVKSDTSALLSRAKRYRNQTCVSATARCLSRHLRSWLANVMSRAFLLRIAGAILPNTIQRSVRWRMANKVTRMQVLQHAITTLGARRYLEVGIGGGACFCTVVVHEKIGVDPIAPSPAVSAEMSKPGACYFALTSDDFFKEVAPQVLAGGVDVVFIDGLHTYSQAYRDCMNSLTYLNSAGLIMLHDCLPTTELEARVALTYADARKLNSGTSWDGAWVGDVWKVIVRLRSQHTDLETCTLHSDHGIGVVYKGRNHRKLSYSLEQIDAMTYEDLAKNTKWLLNLRKPQALDAVMARLLNEEDFRLQEARRRMPCAVARSQISRRTEDAPEHRGDLGGAGGRARKNLAKEGKSEDD